MSLQVCSCCGWSKVTTYHGLRTHQGKMGCTPRGVTVTESEQQFMWGHVELTNNQKDIELDVYASIKTDAVYYYSDMDLQVCHCGWSKVTTYHGLRTHQWKMGCTPKGMRIPKKEQYDWNNQPAKGETVKKENVPRSSSTNSHTVSVAITGRVKVEYNSSFSTPQHSSKKATKSRSQLQDFCTLPQGRRSDREPPTPAYPETVVRPKKKDRRDQTLSKYEQWLHEGRRSDWEPPTPAYPETVVRPKKDRRDQTLSQVADSNARTGYWSTNNYTDPPTAATIKGEPESPILQRSSKKATKSKSGHQLQDFYTLPQVNTSVREHPTPTYPVPVEERKKKERREQTLSQEYWSINSRKDSATTATIKEEPKSPVAVSLQSSQAAKNSTSGYQPHDFSTGVQMTKLGKERPPIPPKVKIKELPTTTHPATVVRHKEQRREDQTLSQNVPVSRSVNSATATTIKERPKSPFSTPQQPVQRVTNSKAVQQLQESCTGLQVNGSGREVSRTPLATVVQPKVKDRNDQTPSQSVPDSTNSAAVEATTKKDPKSVCETAQPDSSTGLKVKELAQMFSAATTQEAAVRPKKKRRGEQNLSQVKLLAQELSKATTVRVTAVQPKENGKEDPKLSQVQNVPDSESVTTQMNSASAETTNEEEDIYSAAGMKVKELAQMFSAITTNKTAIQPKGKHKGEQNLMQAKPLARKVSATTAQVAAVQPKEKDKEDQQVRPTDVKHKIQMREPKVDQGSRNWRKCPPLN
ncbi:uncharacterized protein LOC126404497 [Epinephelus moara]|uniref:uncharacterized protein LOC126404497 n=1 Tax=Epinephelus moara TaxID=300413 RepID=UPI00214EA040|nr:uncharacterized protein LOC126404497 [Epinephelus moara]